MLPLAGAVLGMLEDRACCGHTALAVHIHPGHMATVEEEEEVENDEH